MTQVITVSPATAAYVSDAFKQNQEKTSANTLSPMETAISDWYNKAVSADNPADRSLLSFVHPPSLALAFLTATQGQEPQVTTEQANEEYKANAQPENMPESKRA